MVEDLVAPRVVVVDVAGLSVPFLPKSFDFRASSFLESSNFRSIEASLSFAGTDI